MKLRVPPQGALFFIASLPLILSTSFARGEIIAGPWLQNVKEAGITVMWETDQAGESWVDYGVDALYGNTAGSSDALLIHEVVLSGLASASEYHYRVRTGADASPDAVFCTAPSKGSTGFRFIAYGDSRTNEWSHTEVALAMKQEMARTFILHAGDLTVDSSAGGDLYREDFFTPLEEVFREAPIYISRGNHEATSPLFNQYFSPPTESSGNEDFFSFEYGNVHITVLDTTKDFSSASAQGLWLESDLEAASMDPDIDWLIALFHHPPYSTGEHGSDLDVRTEICPVLESHGVALVLNGHDHDYERIREQNGTVYVVTGGGGAPLRDQGSPEAWSVCYHKNHHFLTLDVEEDRITVGVWGVGIPGKADGDLLDSLVITRDGAWSPTALAGPDRQVVAGGPAILDGGDSYDGEGDPFTYLWSQVSGPLVTLHNPQSPQSFIYPEAAGNYAFRLTCTEGGVLESASDEVRVGVRSPHYTAACIGSCQADTWVSRDQPGTHFGDAPTLNVDAVNPLGYIYLRFQVPEGIGEILQAKLRLFCVNKSTAGGYVRTFSDVAWDENTPTFNDPLSVDGPAVGVFGAVNAGAWAETNITAAFASGTAGNGLISLALYPASDDGADYSSKEGLHPPQLRLVYSGRRIKAERNDPQIGL